MLIEDQKIKIVWSKSTKKKYTDLGYVFTDYGKEFDVDIKDVNKHSRYEIEYICDYCGNKCKNKYYVYTKGRKNIAKDCCRNCKNTKAWEIYQSQAIKQSYDKLQNIAISKGYDLITRKEDYLGTHSDIEYICPKHGTQTIMATNLISGHGCRQCQSELLAKMKRYTPQQVKEIIESKNGNKLLNPEDYIRNNVPNLKVRCNCGNTFIIRLDVYKDQFRCSECAGSESKGEYRVRKYLEANNIEFIPQYSFNDCRDILPLPFDFYLPNYNTCLEYDGQQHEKPQFGKLNFEKLIYHDGIKNEYCRKNNINLIRISFRDYENIDKVLNKELNLCK